MFPSGLQSGSYMKAAAGNSRFIDSLLARSVLNLRQLPSSSVLSGETGRM